MNANPEGKTILVIVECSVLGEEEVVVREVCVEKDDQIPGRTPGYVRTFLILGLLSF